MAELDDILGSLLGGDGKEDSAGVDLSDILLKVMPLINTVSEENDDERLLKALMPYMSQVRKEKLDAAQSMLKIAKLLPLFQDMLGGGTK